MRTRLLPALPLGFAFLLVTLGCHQKQAAADDPDPGPAWFEDATAAVGVEFAHDAGPLDEKYFMPQIVGSGSALFDFDGDGLLDLYLLHNGGPKGKANRLFRQLPSGKFQDVSDGSGLDIAGHNMGVAIADVNNDGRPDVLVTQYGGVCLFLNDGNGKFRDVTKDAGLDNPLWATSAAFLDFDRDGLLDLFVTNYVAYDPSWVCTAANSPARDFCAPKTFKGTSSKLFRNLGGGKFLDVSIDSGIGLKPGPGLGVFCADVDGDGWPDIFVANDGAANHLWINQKNGTFVEEGVARGLALNAMGQTEANMGIGWGDLDNDGLQDVFVTHLNLETHTLWRQGPRGLFRDATTASGMSRPRWRATGFGTVLGDFDHDGHLDVALVAGDITKNKEKPNSRAGRFWGQYAERNQVFANDGGRLRDVSAANPAFTGYDNVGRGLSMGVLRDDGALWLVATAVSDQVRIVRAAAPNRGSWLVVRAVDPRWKRDALGADVTVVAGQQKWVRTIHTGGSYLCSNDPRAHFGLGTLTAIDAVEVAWPDGLKERFGGGPTNRFLTLERGKGDKP